MELHKYDLLHLSRQFFERNDDFLRLLPDLDLILVYGSLVSVKIENNINNSYKKCINKLNNIILNVVYTHTHTQMFVLTLSNFLIRSLASGDI